jgi:hypothetical protein
MLWRGFLFTFAGMKRSFLIGLSLLLALAACTSRITSVELRYDSSPELSAIDSLMWQQPDSAFVLLQEFAASPNADSLDAFGGHYFQLLLSELLYKNDYMQTNRTELLQAVAYFDSLTLTLNDKHHTRHRHCELDPQSPNPNDDPYFLAARAHYINGVGYYERDSVVDACGEYLKALEIMEGHFEENELVVHKAKFMALTYTHLTALYSSQYLHKQAICFGQLSLPYYQKHDAILWHKAWMMGEIGLQYDMMNFYDSACFYYKIGIEILTDTSNLVYRDLAAHQTFLSYEIEKEPNIAVNRLHQLLALSDSKKEYLSRCLTIGEIFFHEIQYDSAFVYLNEVYNYSESIDSKKQAAEWLVEICKEQGRDSEMLEYADFLVPFANQEENQSVVKSQLTELYKTYNQDRLDRQHQIETKEYIKRTTIVGAGLFFVILILSLLYHKNKRHKRNLETLVESERHSHKVQQAALAGRLKRSNAALKDKIGQQDELTKRDKTAASFTEEPICRLIMERVNEGQFLSQMDCTIYQDYALDKNQLSALRNAADRHFNQFTVRISNAHPELTRTDLDYCCLYLLGLTDADVAALMQRAYNTVNERNSKLRRVFGSKNAISVTLQSIANQSTID